MASNQGVGGSSPSEGTASTQDTYESSAKPIPPEVLTAHVLSIGSELMLGHLTDTNATFLAQELAAIGVYLIHVTQVGDDRARITKTLRAALENADLIICTGGVGPTDDDLTREAISDVAGETPYIDPELLSTVGRFFSGRGLVMPERNAKQAWLIPSAEVLLNPVGTAPGWCVRIGSAIILAMPGVPREMFRMWREQALPRIMPTLPPRIFSSVTFKTVGIGESAAEQLLHDLVALDNPVVATYAKDDGVHIRVTAASASAENALRMRENAATQVSTRLSRFIYADNAASLASVLIGQLRARAWTIGIVDVGGGGRLGSSLFAEPEAAGVVIGALASAGPFGDPDAAGDFALSAVERFSADLGVGVTVASTLELDGLYAAIITVSLSNKSNSFATETFTLRSNLAEIQRRAALNAADVIRRALMDLN